MTNTTRERYELQCQKNDTPLRYSDSLWAYIESELQEAERRGYKAGYKDGCGTPQDGAINSLQ